MRPILVAVVMALTLSLGCLPAATLVQPFNENGVTFDEIQVFVFSPGMFGSSVGLTSFSDGSWTGINKTPQWSGANGNEVSSLGFNLNFDYTELPVEVHFYSFLKGTMNGDSAQFKFDSNGSAILNLSPMAAGQFQSDVDAATAAPEPAMLSVVGLALFGLGLASRKRTKV